MSYLVLARKYRPQSFQDVVAQEHVTRTLRNAVKNQRIGSGYLFCGPRGTGKTTVARILAKAVNCAEGPTENPCGVCPSCIEITGGNSLDVLEIDAASNTGVDDIRTLRENIRYLPTHGKKRVYIVDEVHRLSASAFDALLKTLEEPPPHVIFIFATTEPLKVPETILSRTQRFDFRRVSVEDLTTHLAKIAGLEGISLNGAALTLLARKADGSVRDALSLMDQVIAYAGETITEKEVAASLGLVDRRFLFDFTAAVAASEPRRVLELTRQVFESGIDVTDFVSELLDHLRTLLVLQTDPASAKSLPFGPSEIEEFTAQAGFFKVGDLLRLIKMAIDLNGDLRSGLDERLLLEVTAVKMAEMESTVRFEEVLAQLQSGVVMPRPESPGGAPGAAAREPDFFQRAAPQKGSPGVAAKPAMTALPTSADNLIAASRAVNIMQVQTGWDAFLNSLRQVSPMLASQLRMGEVKTVHDNQVQVMYYSSGEASLQLVQKSESLNLITRALCDHFKANLTIAFAIDREREQPATPAEKPSRPRVDPRALVEQSPRLKSLLEKVDGEIVGVKKVEE